MSELTMRTDAHVANPAVHVDTGTAFLGGFIGTIVMTALLYMANAMQMVHMDLATMLGTMIGLMGPAALWVGMAMHFMMGTFILAWLYARAIELLHLQPTWEWGAVLGFVNWIAFGIMMGMLPMVHPMIRAGQMPAPGWFAIHQGAMAIVGTLMLHLIYGGIIGAIARPTSS